MMARNLRLIRVRPPSGPAALRIRESSRSPGRLP